MFQLKKQAIHLLSTCLIAVTLFGVAPVASATEIQPTLTVTSCNEQITPRTEETVWVVREYNGKKQMRLWSITRGIWLTDWIDYDL